MQPTTTGSLETAVRKATWRLVPFLMLAYFVAFVDRVNSGFAALQMNRDIGLSHAAFGFGAGIFYLSYVLFEVPSNLAMQRVGARRWIARIMVSWGLVAGLMAAVVGPRSFYAVRFLLGAAEAGFFPGVILYLTYWFPAAHRGRIISLFMVSIPVSSLLGSPISAALLGTDGWLGLRGWQWMYLLEAVPAVLLGIAALALLPDDPAGARWLDTAERRDLAERLAAEARETRAAVQPGARPGTWRVLLDRRVLVLSLAYAGPSGLSQALSIWAPQMIKAFGLTNMQVGLLNAIPFAAASAAMIWWGWRSDRAGERTWHTVLPLALSAVSLGASFLAGSVAPFIVVLCGTLIGTYAVKGPFWALSSEWLAGTAAAAGIAQVNAIGNLAGFAGNYLIGAIEQATGSYPLAVQPLVLLAVLGCIAVPLLGRGRPAALPSVRSA